MIQRGWGETNLKLQLAPVGRRGFGLQAEAFFFSSLWLDNGGLEYRHDQDSRFLSRMGQHPWGGTDRNLADRDLCQ